MKGFVIEPGKKKQRKQLKHSKSTRVVQKGGPSSPSSPTLRQSSSVPDVRFAASGGLALPPSKPLFQLDMDTINMYDLPGFNDGRSTNAKSAWATSSRKRSSSPQPQSPQSPTSHGSREHPSKISTTTATTTTTTKSMSRKNSLSSAMDRMSMMKLMEEDKIYRAENPTTGLEAIQYFAKQGEAAKLKFIYCVREECLNENTWSPYDLVVSDADTAVTHGEHFIMSQKGLVHQIPGSASDFIPIHEWVSGSVNYKVIRALRTFKMVRDLHCYCNTFYILKCLRTLIAIDDFFFFRTGQSD